VTRRRRITWLVAGAIGLAALLLAAGGFVLTRPWPARTGPPPADLDLEDVSIESGSGSRLSGWFGAGEEGRGAVLLVHGHMESRLRMVSRARFLRREGYGVLLVDLQAHGESPGERVTFGKLETLDAEAALRWLAARCPGRPLGGIGYSLGGAVLLLARGDVRPEAIVVEATFATLEGAIRGRMRRYATPVGAWCTPLLTMQMPWWIGASVDELRPVDRVADLGCALLVIHGGADRSTPPSEARALFEAAREPKDLWIVDGADHFELYGAAPAEYERRVLAVLGAHLR
jgi:alpha-beta hydrolase superfamily lysophospholipase